MASRADLEYLSEGQVLDSVELTVAEAEALNSTALVTVQPSNGRWQVTAAHAVGAARYGQLRVRVRPKVGTVQVLRLLARAQGVQGLKIDQSLIGVDPDPDLTAVLAVLFAAEAATALAPGPPRGYRTQQQSANVLRGRLRIRDQELRRFGLPLPLEITTDEWTTDTTENRRIRAANGRLLRVPALPAATRRHLTRIDRILADVWDTPKGADLPAWRPTRLNLRLHRLLLLADLVLDQTSVEHRIGDLDVHGFVLSMPWLFEKLITRMLIEIRGATTVRAQKNYPLDSAGRLTIKPDLVFTDGPQIIAVADTKYKLLDDTTNLPNADAYQLITYCTRLGLPAGHLIYSTGGNLPADSFEIAGTAVRLVVHVIDLTQPMHAIASQVLQVSATIHEFVSW